MNGEVAAPITKPRDPGRIVIRIIAVTMLLTAMMLAVSLIWLAAEGIIELGFDLPTALISLGWAFLVLSSVQLFHLRFSGWIASVAILAVATALLAYVIYMNKVDEYCVGIENTLYQEETGQERFMLWNLPGDYYWTHAVVPNRLRFVLAVSYASLAFLALEWQRFRRDAGKPSMAVTYAKVGLFAAFLAAAGTWNLWAASHLYERRILAQAEAPAPHFDNLEYDRMPVTLQRRVATRLVMRTAIERSEALSRSIASCPRIDDAVLLAPEDVPVVCAAARGGTEIVKEHLYPVLDLIGTPEALEVLLDPTLNSRADQVCRWPIFDLPSHQLSERAFAHILKVAAQKGRFRASYLRVLGEFPDPRAIPILIEAIRDSDREVRYQTAWALGRYYRFNDQRVTSALVTVAQDNDENLRLSAFRSLTLFSCPEAVQTIQRALLNESDYFTKDRMCNWLGEVGSAWSIPILIDVLDAAEPPTTEARQQGQLHQTVHQALSALTGKGFGQNAEAWRKWWREAASGFDVDKHLAEQLFTSIPPLPRDRKAARSLRENEESSYSVASLKQGWALLRLGRRRPLMAAPYLARYLRLPKDQRPGREDNRIAAEMLLDWGYREGIDWWVDYLERAVSDPVEHVTLNTFNRIARVTGVNFFSDAKRWREWWAENRGGFPRALESGK